MKKVGEEGLKSVLLDIIERARDRGLLEHVKEIVLVGGSALCASRIRKDTEDVDLYVSSPDLLPLIRESEAYWRKIYGENFFIDVTTSGDLWGEIRIGKAGDIKDVFKLDANGESFEVKVLSPETIFVLKSDIGREKDIEDLRLISHHTTPERICEAFASLVKRNDRDRMNDLAVTVLAEIQAHYGRPVTADLVHRTGLSPASQKEILGLFGLSPSPEGVEEEESQSPTFG